MITQQRRLCLGAMKVLQWPTLARNATVMIWPGRSKTQMSILPYSCSSTMATAEKESSVQPLKDSEATNKSPEKENVEPSVTHEPDRQKPKTILGKEVEAVKKVAMMSSALKISSNFNPQQRLEALKNLVAEKVRPLPLIQSLTEGISSSSATLNIKELSDLLFALAKLSYVNEEVLSKTCEALKSKLKQNQNAAVVGSSISSLRRLHWKDPDLLDEFSIWIQNNFQTFQSPSNFIYTLALQNHSPPNLEELLQLVWQDASRKRYDPATMVNFVWSIYALNLPSTHNQTKEKLNSFFTPKFLSSIGTGPFDIPVWVKLWNLHAVAKLGWAQADFKIPHNVKSSVSDIFNKSNKTSMISEVIQLLFKEELDSNLYKTGVPSQMGFPIDVVFTMDKSMNAVPLHLASPDCSRIAVMIHSYQECCHPSKEPNGIRAFEMRLLEDGYKVISVPYYILGGGYAQVHEFFEAALKKIVRKHD